MGVTVQVRDLDSGVQERLRAAAEREGISLSAFLRRELTSLANNLEVRDRARELNATPLQVALGGPFPALAHLDSAEIVRMIREDRDSH